MLIDWAKATTTTTGTGDITLSAVTGFPLPSDHLPNGAFVPYCILTADGKFEAGVGKLGASNVLTRERVNSTYDGSSIDSTTPSALSLAAGTHMVLFGSAAHATLEPAMFPCTEQSNANAASSHYQSSGGSNTTPTAQRATAYPFLLMTPGTLTGFAINVATAGASSTTLVGLYEQLASNGTPGRRIAKTSATIDTSTTGYKTQSIATPVRLEAGWYWSALCVTAGTAPALTGAAGTYSAYGCTGVTAINGVRCDVGSTTDLADPFPTASHVWLSGAAPIIGLLLS